MPRNPEKAGSDRKLQFGKRVPEGKPGHSGDADAVRRRKRTAALAMTALGISAIGGAIWAASRDCKSPGSTDPNDTRAVCRRSGGGHVSWSSNSSSSSNSTTQATQRGGFGRTGLSFSSFGGS